MRIPEQEFKRRALYHMREITHKSINTNVLHLINPTKHMAKYIVEFITYNSVQNRGILVQLYSTMLLKSLVALEYLQYNQRTYRINYDKYMECVVLLNVLNKEIIAPNILVKTIVFNAIQT